MNHILTCEICENQINTNTDTYGHDDKDRLVCDTCISKWNDKEKEA